MNEAYIHSFKYLCFLKLHQYNNTLPKVLLFLAPVYAWPLPVLATETRKALNQSWSMSLYFFIRAPSMP